MKLSMLGCRWNAIRRMQFNCGEFHITEHYVEEFEKEGMGIRHKPSTCVDILIRPGAGG
jgi:hypothetical protein